MGYYLSDLKDSNVGVKYLLGYFALKLSRCSKVAIYSDDHKTEVGGPYFLLPWFIFINSIFRKT